MRAEFQGEHVSGAERIVPYHEVEKTVLELLKRPRVYDKVVITVERLKDVEIVPKALPILSYDFKSVEEARAFAVSKLVEAGVPKPVAELAIKLLHEGPNPKGGNMRGAVLMDVETGERLEPDRERGIRTTRMDWKDRKYIKEVLKKRGIKREYLERLIDALAVATKNVYCGVLAELCWSDDPEYTTGYVAGPHIGYVRIKPMKEEGVPIGGRVYFIRKENLEKIIQCLQEKPILINNL